MSIYKINNGAITIIKERLQIIGATFSFQMS